MTPYKILIVEDEILIADSIKRYLTIKGHEVIGQAISYEEAEQLYHTKDPDIVLLDIRLYGEKTGIDFAHFIQQQTNPKPFLYLTSQFDSNTIHAAKETFPSGYLSKPIQKESLFASLEIAMHKYQSQQNNFVTIPLFDGIKKYLIPINDILYLESEHVYVKVYLLKGNHIIQRSSMKDLLEQLPPKQFLQAHRSFVINCQRVSHWDTEFIYFDEKAIPVSRNRRKEVFSILK